MQVVRSSLQNENQMSFILWNIRSDLQPKDEICDSVNIHVSSKTEHLQKKYMEKMKSPNDTVIGLNSIQISVNQWKKRDSLSLPPLLMEHSQK